MKRVSVKRIFNVITPSIEKKKRQKESTEERRKRIVDEE